MPGEPTKGKTAGLLLTCPGAGRDEQQTEQRPEAAGVRAGGLHGPRLRSEARRESGRECALGRAGGRRLERGND